MALLNILCYPDPRLHKVATPVTAFDDKLRKLVADMLETMYEAQGVGLAATQVDVHQRLVVLDTSEERNQATLNRYTGPTRVDSYSNQNRTTVGRKTTWENQNIGAGGGSWQSFGDSTTPGFKSSEG